MIKVIKYTNKTNELDVQESKYTSQAHKEYHEGLYPYLLTDYDQIDVTALEVDKIKVGQRVARIAAGEKFMAELGVFNTKAFEAGTLTQEQFFSLKQKLAPIKDFITEGSLDFANGALQASNITEMPAEVKAEYSAKMQAVLDAEVAELNPPDTHPLPEVVEQPVVEPTPEPTPDVPVEPQPEPTP